jgi:immune inhibitor A
MPGAPIPRNSEYLRQFTNLQGPMDIESMIDPLPTSGDQTLLVILVDFPDKEGVFTGQEWVGSFFGYEGFSEYFEEISYSKLLYTGDVVGMLGDVPVLNSPLITYVRLPYPITYYADGWYGYKTYNEWQFPKNNGGVVYHAVQELDEKDFDFSPYVDSLTNRVENLVVVFAGNSYSYTGDPNNSLEATAYRLSDAGLPEGYTTTNGYLIDNYTFCPELYGTTDDEIARIGVCAHEHGHALGMFDLYDHSGFTTGVGDYGLMAYGAYGADDGLKPFHPSAFTKEYFGWAEPTVVPVGKHIISLPPSEIGAHIYKLYPRGELTNDEYFLLENRQPVGFDQEWTTAGLRPGLLIWHIDGEVVNAYSFDNKVNTQGLLGSPEHQGVILVEADGYSYYYFDMINPSLYPNLNYGEWLDTWNSGRVWDDLTTPSARLWDGSSSRITIRVLAENSGNLTIEVNIDDPYMLPEIYLPFIAH